MARPSPNRGGPSALGSLFQPLAAPVIPLRIAGSKRSPSAKTAPRHCPGESGQQRSRRGQPLGNRLREDKTQQLVATAMQRPRRAKADAASLALARQLESEDARPRRAAAKPRAKSPAKPRAKSPARPKKPSSKRAAKQTTEPARAGLSCALFAVMAYANYMQHHLPQPVPRAWYDETGRDMGQHEIELRAYLGVWVYLTAQILLVLLVYHTLSVIAATTGKYETQAHAAAPACLGLGLVVYGLFFFFYLLMRCCNPTWRDQWTYHESLGVPYERWMHLMHTPLWLCPLRDAVWKSNSELGYRQPERHRADAGMEATSRRWRGI